MLFARSGFDASSLNELAEEIGISKAGIYHYFKTKQDVYDALIVQTLHGLVEYVSGVVAGMDAPVDQLLAFMTAHADYFERNHAAFRAMLVSFTSMSAPESRREAVELRTSYEQLLRGIIAQGVTEGSFREVDPAWTGRAVLSMLNWMARWFQPGGEKTAADVAQEYADLLVRGLRS